MVATQGVTTKLVAPLARLPVAPGVADFATASCIGIFSMAALLLAPCIYS